MTDIALKRGYVYTALGLSSLLVLFTPAEASAAQVGDMLTSFAKSLGTIPTLISAVCYVVGAGAGIAAINKAWHHVDHPDRVPLSEPIMRAIVAGGLIGLPQLINYLVGTLGVSGTGTSGAGITVAAGAGGGLDQAFASLMSSINVPLRMVLTYVSYLIGSIYAAVGTTRLMKGPHEARGPYGKGTAVTFLVSAVLLSLPGVMDAFATSLFGSADGANGISLSSSASSALSWAGGGQETNYNNYLQAALLWVQLLGWIGFIRGWIMLKHAADGGNNSVAGGITHIIGGVLAANVGMFLTIVDTTMGTKLFGG